MYSKTNHDDKEDGGIDFNKTNSRKTRGELKEVWCSGKKNQRLTEVAEVGP